MIMEKKTNFQEVADRVEAARLLQEGGQQEPSNKILLSLARDIIQELPDDGTQERTLRRMFGETEEEIKASMGEDQ